jgi:hypothetical protein
MSEKVNCIKCKSVMNKKPGLWVCDRCWNSGSIRINTVSRQIAAVAKEDVNPPDMVDHPKHYNQGNIEVIDVIEDWNLDFKLGNAIKYIARAGKKNNEVKQDLEKAIWYIKRFIDREE